MKLVNITDIELASRRILHSVIRTPLLRCPAASEARLLWLKPENLQTTGSFKVRGAYNALVAMPAERRRLGTVTYSSGNHAQALAWAARQLDVRCTVVMPEDAASVKVEATRALGAEIIMVPAAKRKEYAESLSVDQGMTLIPPYDHHDVIAGQGTIGLEIVHDLPSVELVFVPVGGGALASGIATAIKSQRPDVRVIGVEPDLAADAYSSLRHGKLEQWPMTETSKTIADGLRTSLSPLTYEHLRRYVDEVRTVSEGEIQDAMRFLTYSAHLVAEPSGAVALAGYQSVNPQHADQRAVVIVSGGNVESGTYLKAIM